MVVCTDSHSRLGLMVRNYYGGWKKKNTGDRSKRGTAKQRMKEEKEDEEKGKKIAGRRKRSDCVRAKENGMSQSVNIPDHF